jgi:hypothetical protein
MQDRRRQFDEIFLQRTAGPLTYTIRVRADVPRRRAGRASGVIPGSDFCTVTRTNSRRNNVGDRTQCWYVWLTRNSREQFCRFSVILRRGARMPSKTERVELEMKIMSTASWHGKRQTKRPHCA